MAAEQNRLARFKAKVEELGTGPDGVLNLTAGYRAVADATGLSYDYVYQVYAAKSGKKGVGPAAVKKFEQAFGAGAASGWMDTPLDDPGGEPSDHDFEPMRPPTVSEAVEALAQALVGMDPLGRELASTVLANLAKTPDLAPKLLPTLEQLVKNHSLPPQGPPPAKRTNPSKETASKTAANKGGKTHLVLKIGGGQRQQFDLPLSRSAFRTESAPPNEREWYDRVKAAPKASAKSKEPK